MAKKTTTHGDQCPPVTLSPEELRQVKGTALARARASTPAFDDLVCPEHGSDNMQVGNQYVRTEDGSWVGVTDVMCGECGHYREHEWPLTPSTIGPMAPRAAWEWLSKQP